MSGLRVAVVGGGILGLSVADRLVAQGLTVTVVEKEPRWAQHQTGHNSGVIHSGIYYAPGSHKARMCRSGSASMFAFASEHGVDVRRTGKLIVATADEELPRLAALCERGRANGLDVRRITPDEARELEPELSCVAALHVPETGIVDYAGVCRVLAARLAEGGADLRLSTRALGIEERAGRAVLRTTGGDVEADRVVNCAGLQSDLLARRGRERARVQIVPFRGEYFELRPERRHLVRGLIYPVPDPALPFLGVHLTRGTDGSVHAGPNAVLALAREGYDWSTVRPRELGATLAYPGLWRLARRHRRTAVAEVARSMSRRRFAASLQRLVPAIERADLVRAPAGVRAQAVLRDGALVDDFLIERDSYAVHVLNAPSPAATSAFEIAAHVAGLVTG